MCFAFVSSNSERESRYFKYGNALSLSFSYVVSGGNIRGYSFWFPGLYLIVTLYIVNVLSFSGVIIFLCDKT